MKKITATAFLSMIRDNPAVFEHWDTPLEITEFVYCNDSPITHLSNSLSFTGYNEFGDTARFENCQRLTTATGTFQKSVGFIKCGIHSIQNLHVLQKSPNAASFVNCPNLQIATGTYPGFVNFYKSGIRAIQNLHIESPNNKGYYAGFFDCQNLHTLENWDLSKNMDIEPYKLKKELKRRAALKKFVQETKPQKLPFL
jgi:hypothetical protein